MTKVIIGTAINSNVVGSMSGGVLIAKQSHQVDKQALAALFNDFQLHCSNVAQKLPPDDAMHIRDTAKAVKAELSKDQPDSGCLRLMLGKMLTKVQSLTGFADAAVSLAKNIAEIYSKLPD